MAHFAQIEDGVVRQVIVVNACDLGGCDPHLDPDNLRDHSSHDPDFDFPEIEPAGQAFLASLGLSGEWRMTSYSGSIRGKYAGQGDTYDAELDAFVSPVMPEIAFPE